MSIKISIVLAFITLIGCSAPNVKNDFSFSSKTTKGLVIGSITQDEKPGASNAYAIFYIYPEVEGLTHTMIKSRTKIMGGLLPVFEDGDFVAANGRIFAIDLEPGIYKLKSWQVNNGTGARLHPSEEPPALEFKVTAGEITYIGNFHMLFRTGKNIVGVDVVGDAVPEIRNESDRDIKIFKKKYPGLANQNIDIRPLKLGLWYSGESTESQKEIDIQSAIPR